MKFSFSVIPSSILIGAGKAGHRVKQVLPLVLAILCFYMLWGYAQSVDLALLLSQFRDISALSWALSAALTGLSFLAVARYDTVAHRHFGTGACTGRATYAGAIAIAVSQTTGFGPVVASLVRWRLQPHLGMIGAARITFFVAICFVLSWAVVTPLVWLIFSPPDTGLNIFVLPLALLAIFAGPLFLVMRPTLTLGKLTLTLPSLPTFLTMVLFCAVDTSASCGALYLLLPADTALEYAQLFPVFILALGFALLSGTPGGVGPFELTLLMLLPEGANTGILAAILGFRLIYYAIPALIGAATLLHKYTDPAQKWLSEAAGDLDRTLSDSGARAELGVLRQNGGAPLHSTGGVCAMVRTPQTITALFDPITGRADTNMAPLQNLARRQNRVLCFYKISGRHALGLRRAGWTVLRIADEALITPAKHTLEGSTYRQLRRKLRHAQHAGVTITADDTLLPWSAMERISNIWEDQHGVARGLSMGRFEAQYLSHQKLFLAYQEGILIGFVSFHTTAHEWCLDLMRVLPDAPDGTMHALVQQAIQQATLEQVPLLSLAAVPSNPNRGTRIERRLRRHHDQRANGAGLRQFKTCFAPTWRPLYIAAAHWPALLLAILDLARAIKHGKSLHPALPITPPIPPFANVNLPHKGDE